MSVKNTLQWYSCTDILLIWRNCWPHEHTCTHKPTHTHTLFTVKVNGSAKGPDSTLLYYHGTLRTVRLDLLGEHMSTAAGFNTSKRPITGQKTAAASVEDVGLGCLWSALQSLKNCAGVTPHSVTKRFKSFFLGKNALVSASPTWIFTCFLW